MVTLPWPSNSGVKKPCMRSIALEDDSTYTNLAPNLLLSIVFSKIENSNDVSNGHKMLKNKRNDVRWC
jgi:hypothetical protein